MSWLNKIKTDLTITCGDGSEYVPDWVNASKAKDYNVAEFEFVETDGALVERRRPKARRLAIEILFQGEDHLDIAEQFEASADDPAAWTITHPYYGAILVQPISLTFDNSVHNISRVTGIVVETIDGGVLRPKLSVPDKIAEDKIVADGNLATTFSNDIPAKKVSVLQQLTKSVDSMYNNISKKIADNTDFSEFFNAYNEVNALINEVVYDGLALIQQVQNLISMPANFAQTITDRLAMLRLQFSLLSDGVANLITRDSKKIYEAMAGTVITTTVLSSVTNIGNAYINRTDVLDMIDAIYQLHNDYIADLDTLQTDNGGSPDSFIADATSLISISSLVGYAITELIAYAGNSRQERSIYLEEDSNVILLAQRFYGLTADDSTIDYVIETNKIQLKEMLEVKKGRKLVYYV